MNLGHPHPDPYAWQKRKYLSGLLVVLIWRVLVLFRVCFVCAILPSGSHNLLLAASAILLCFSYFYHLLSTPFVFYAVATPVKAPQRFAVNSSSLCLQLRSLVNCCKHRQHTYNDRLCISAHSKGSTAATGQCFFSLHSSQDQRDSLPTLGKHTGPVAPRQRAEYLQSQSSPRIIS